jgi:hypothetical protein
MLTALHLPYGYGMSQARIQELQERIRELETAIHKEHMAQLADDEEWRLGQVTLARNDPGMLFEAEPLIALHKRAT